MDKQTLFIGDIVKANDGNIVLALDFDGLDIREQYIQKGFQEIRDEFGNKEIEVVGANIKFKTNIIDVEVSSSLTNFRNIFIKKTKSSKTSKVRLGDEAIINV